ncbi:MAG: NADH-quinone oxidoreductase subunit A [Phycisphaeraceae bacterium]|nr:MAG: NADH-quinone oxidoreductase subunit A [Phycisphaeraceae bacterium]
MTLASIELNAYLPVAILLMMAITFAVANVVLTSIIGPSRQGAVKGISYESGMDPITPARKRFNVRFYVLAMIFLVFDVEIIFLYPWAAMFAQMEPMSAMGAEFLGRILFFLFTTVIAFIYAFRKGVFRFD